MYHQGKVLNATYHVLNKAIFQQLADLYNASPPEVQQWMLIMFS